VAPVKVFISYARKDNTAPPDADPRGFVTVLNQQLQYELDILGSPQPVIWRDEQIADGDQFEPLIDSAIRESGILLVVLSRNWLGREWCERELKSFERRWSKDDQLRIRRRIIIAAKHHIEPNERPLILQGQVGYRFFELDGNPRVERLFYDRGAFDPRFYEQVRRLGGYVWQRAKEIASEDRAPSIVSSDKAPDAFASRDEGDASSASPSGRVVYVAKPATDMLAAYARVVAELRGRGYVVEPSAEATMPTDKSAVAFVDEAMEKSEIAVHLLGGEPGYCPEGCPAIAALQLARAAATISTRSSEGADRSFRRMIWVPKVLESGDKTTAPQAERDPFPVLNKLDPQLPTDKVEGDTLTKFLTFLLQYLDRTAPQSDALPPADKVSGSTRIYVCHCDDDTDYALEIAKALERREVEAVIPALEGDAAQLKEWHRRNLLDCDSVVLCWGAASEVWVRATSRELKSWRDLGRAQSFLRRGLVAGPPPGKRKSVFSEHPPRSEIDVVLDLTEIDKPSPEALDPLVAVPRSGGQ
jgi:hypothetical protein